MKTTHALFALILGGAALGCSQTAGNVLVVVNQASAVSKEISEYYVARRHIPSSNICRVDVPKGENVSPEDFRSKIADPIARCLRSRHLEEKILYIVTTLGLPLRVTGHGAGMLAETASVDSELTLLYSDMRGQPHNAPSGILNPFFAKSTSPFRHPDFPIYLVTRLAGFDLSDAKGIIDRALEAHNRGYFVLDLRASDNTAGNRWLLEAAAQLPKDRVILDRSGTVVYNQSNVIAYAAWGSNDPDRKQRHLGFRWLPGAIVTEYVSTDGRTFARPPDNWVFNTGFGSSNQNLSADYIRDGATGASGHVDEPYLQFTPRPDIVLPAYYRGRNLAESFYLGIRALSWMNIVIGDPLCSLGKP